jgi:hypothetical protein
MDKKSKQSFSFFFFLFSFLSPFALCSRRQQAEFDEGVTW